MEFYALFIGRLQTRPEGLTSVFEIKDPAIYYAMYVTSDPMQSFL